jgi:hypothetical protein
MVAAGLLALLIVETAPLAGAEDPAETPASPEAPAPAESPPGPPPAVEPVPPPRPAPPPVVVQPPPPRMYGDRGSIELGIGLGYSSQTGFVGAGGVRYFVIDRVAPGIEGTYVSGGSSATRYGLLLAALRIVPIRLQQLAIVVTGRAGRVMVGGTDDGWGAGGAAGILFLFTPTVGLELGYEALWLYPDSFCAEVETCVLHGPVFAVRFGF